MKWIFQGWRIKNNVEFPGVFVFGLWNFQQSKGSNTILWNIQGVELCLEFPEVKKWKIPGGLPPTPTPVWIAQAIVKRIARTKMYIKCTASYLSWWRNKVSGIYWYSKATHIQKWNVKLWFSYSKDCLVNLEKKVKTKVWKFWYRTISSTIVVANYIEFPSILDTVKMISLKKQLLKLA